ncbi:hypothetical protein THAOC_14336 [Thalassiosira oceanica]|uniref:Uncharacterized protein n=1 Tax=Thalassiosira oceanica TaxID=159749 RepID=K0SFG2_THAOC|nr:hypothetical protein THAOC_14336 [Thalassiosira oceanica]|eukprot:EJK64878.1 hypothetical protein THAOC_14336 [Thalassiosira oceanica]
MPTLKRRRVAGNTAGRAGSDADAEAATSVEDGEHVGLSCCRCSRHLVIDEDHVVLGPCSCTICPSCLLRDHARRGANQLTCAGCGEIITSHRMNADDQQESVEYAPCDTSSTVDTSSLQDVAKMHLISKNGLGVALVRSAGNEGEIVLLLGLRLTKTGQEDIRESFITKEMSFIPDPSSGTLLPADTIDALCEFGAWLHPQVVAPSVTPQAMVRSPELPLPRFRFLLAARATSSTRTDAGRCAISARRRSDILIQFLAAPSTAASIFPVAALQYSSTRNTGISCASSLVSTDVSDMTEMSSSADWFARDARSLCLSISSNPPTKSQTVRLAYSPCTSRRSWSGAKESSSSPPPPPSASASSATEGRTDAGVPKCKRFSFPSLLGGVKALFPMALRGERPGVDPDTAEPSPWDRRGRGDDKLDGIMHHRAPVSSVSLCRSTARGYIADRPERSYQLGLQLTPPRTSDMALEVCLTCPEDDQRSPALPILTIVFVMESALRTRQVFRNYASNDDKDEAME